MFSVGDGVAWELICGSVMAGRVDEVMAGYGTGDALMVRRVDGTVCGPIPLSRARLATPDDVRAALAFYTTPRT
jgi:hypothetical protein